MTTKEAVMDKLDEVEDPELELSIVELGLVYDVRFEDKDEGLHAEVDLTLTSPGCPAAPEIMAAAHRAALQTDGLDLGTHQPRLDAPLGPENPRQRGRSHGHGHLGLRQSASNRREQS